MKLFFAASLATLLASLTSPAAAQVSRTLHALVIGCDYEGTKFQLPSPVGDAERVAAALGAEPIGFEVTLLKNPGRKAFLDAVDAFGQTLTREQGVGLFYFSGHGMQHEGENYLMPSGASPGYREDLPTECVAASRVVTRMAAAGNGANLLFLDACRDSPLPSATTKGAVLPGLVQMSGSGLLIGFAADSGKVALDSGKGSRYTNALLKHLATPGISVAELLTRVRRDVITDTARKQEPFVYMGLDELFAFVPKPEEKEVESAEMVLMRQTLAKVEAELKAAKGDKAKADELAKELDAARTALKVAETSVLTPGGASPAPGNGSNPTVGPADGTTSVMARTNPSDSTGVGNLSTMMPSTAGGFPAVTATPPSTGMGFVNGQGMGMVWVPETECWVDKHELVQSVYEAITGTNPSTFKNANGPVETVSWTKAMEFCDKLTKREAELGKLPAGYKYTLPTDAQWSIFAAGTKLEDSVVRRSRPAPVGSMRPNPLGLYDMMGNVWEWAYDDYNKEMNRGVSTAGLSGIDKTGKVVRGASYSASKSAMFQIELRAADLASKPDKSVGFRVVLSK